MRDNATELRELASFRRRPRRCAAPTSPAPTSRRRASRLRPTPRAGNLAVTYFLARLWDGSTDFEVDDDRFSAAIAEIEDCTEPEAGEVEAIVPLVGFQMPATRVDLNGASIVRADAVDVPADAARGERPERRRLGAHLPDHRSRLPR